MNELAFLSDLITLLKLHNVDTISFKEEISQTGNVNLEEIAFTGKEVKVCIATESRAVRLPDIIGGDV